MRSDHQDVANQQSQIYDEIRAVGQDVRTMKLKESDEMKHNRVDIRKLVAYYDEYDRRIDVRYDEHNLLRGTLLDDGQPIDIICCNYRDAGIGAVPGLPMIAQIYERIS